MDDWEQNIDFMRSSAGTEFSPLVSNVMGNNVTWEITDF